MKLPLNTLIVQKISSFVKLYCLCSILFSATQLNAQVPLAFYDFELNSDRNNTVETSVQEIISGVGSPSLTVSSLTAAHGAGNGTAAAYGGSNTGYAIGYYGFTTGGTTASAPHVQFGPFNCTGFSGLSVTLDVLGIGSLMPANVDVYWSTDNVTFTRVAVGTNVTTGYVTRTFSLPAATNNATTLYLRVIGFNAGASPTSTDGVMQLDNFTLRATTLSSSATLIDAAAHGVGLSSGGTYFPPYTSLILNGSGITVNLSSDLILGTTAATTALTLTDGTLAVGNNSLTFQTSNVPVTRTNGAISFGTSANLSFGRAGFTGGAAFTIPDNVFTTNPLNISSFTVQRAGALTLNNQDINTSSHLNLTAGVVNSNNRTITVAGNITGAGTYAGTGSIVATTAASTIAGVTISNLILNNSGGFSLVGNLSITEKLTLTSGELTIGNNTLTLRNGDIFLERTSGSITTTSTSNIIFGTAGNTGGASFVLPNNIFTNSPVSINNITINRINSITLGNQPLVVNGTITLTLGNLDMGTHDLTFQNGNAPIARNGTTQTGTITIAANRSLIFGTAGNIGGNAFTIPNSCFTGTPFTIQNLTVNRTNALGLGQSMVIDGGSLNLVLGRVDIGAGNTLTFQNGDLPIVRTAGTLNPVASSLIAFGSAGNTGGADFTIPNGALFNNPETVQSLTINRTNELSFGNQGLVVNGTMHLESGNVNIGAITITFQNGNTPITRNTGTLVTTSATNLIFGTTGNTGGNAFNLPDGLFNVSNPIINGLAINRVNELGLGNQPLTINGTLTLTAGVFNIEGRSLIFQTSSAPIARNGTTQTGTITTNNLTNLTFGTAGNTGGNAFAIPANVFTNTPYTLNTLTINRTNALTLNTQGTVIDGGALTLTAGVLSVGASTLTLQNSNTPLVRTSGTLTVSTTSNLSFGSAGNTGGNAFTIPDNFFTTSPAVLNNLTVHRTNIINLGNQELTINGTLQAEAGELGIAAGTLSFRNSDVPITRSTGTITAISTSNITFGTTGNLGGAAFTLPNDIFTTGSTFNAFTVNRTNSLSLGNQNVTVNGNLNLITGILHDNGNTITVQGNITGTGTHTQTASGRILMNGASGSTISGVTTDFIELDNMAGFSLSGGLIVNGSLALTNGALAIGTNTLTFRNGNVPITRTTGTLTTGLTANIVFGTVGNLGGTAFSLPSGLFTSADNTVNNITINRTNSLSIVNTGLTVNGTLTLTAGELIVDAATLAFQTSNTPIARTTGSITTNNNSTIRFGNVGFLGGNAFTLPTNTFTNTPTTVNSLILQRTNAITLAQSLTVDGGALTLTAGILGIGTGNTITFQNSNTPIVRTTGTITVATTSNVAFGSTGNTGGTAFTLPDGLFTTSPPSLGSFTVNRTNTLTLGNQGLTINETLNLVAGTFIINAHTLTFQNGNTPLQRTAGSLTVTSLSNLTFGTTGNLGGAAFTLPDNYFTSSPVAINNFTINRTNKLTIGNQPFVINGGIVLILGEIDFLNTTLTFQNGNAPIARTSGSITLGSTGSLVFGTTGNTGGNAFTVPANAFTNNPLQIANFSINRTNSLTLGQSLTIDGGALNLTAGVLGIGANNTLTLQNSNIPIVRTSGTLSVATTSNIAFGSAGNTGGNAFTIPNNMFTVNPSSLGSFTVNRTNTLTIGNQTFTINGTLNLVAGSFNVGSQNLTFQNGDVPMARTSGTLITSGSPSYNFGTAGNTGGAAATIPDNFFSANPVTFTNIILNRTNPITLGNQSFQLSGALTLTLGEINVGNAGLIFHTSNTPIVRNGTSQTGTIGGSATGSLTFGITGSTGGNAFAIPNNTFTASPFQVNNFTVNRTNPLTHNNQSLTINGSLILTTGSYVYGNNTLTLQNGNTPLVRTTGTISLGATANLIFGTTGNTGGNAFIIPDNIFASAPSINSFSINRTNSLTLNNQNLTLAGNLNLTGGILNDAGRTITVNGNITGTATHTGSGFILMPTGGSSISGATLANIQLNNAGGFSLSGSPTITSVMTLTAGTLTVGANTITYHTSNTPIVRTSGTLTMSTNSGLRFGTPSSQGGSAFTLPNDLFTGNVDFGTLAINRINSVTLNNQNISLRSLLSVEEGVLILPSNYLFTLKSTSIVNTALVGPMGTTANVIYNTGASFRVERYIPQQTGSGVRAFRDLAPSVNTGGRTIFQQWQESGTNGLESGINYGTHITGVAGSNGVHAATGFDITATGAGSLSTYDINGSGVGAWRTWTRNAGNSTNQTNDTLSAFKGYRILIRGNRLVNLAQVPTPTTMNAPATLRTRGRLVTGNVVFNTAGVTANGATNSTVRLSAESDGFTMIGNPYACAVDWDLLHGDVSTSNIASTYFLYDPNVGSTGGYATYNATTGISVPGSSAINQYIQPGQAFFIENTSTTPSITFKETHKVTNTAALTTTFRNNNTNANFSRILIDCKKNVSGRGDLIMDGVAVAFSNSFTNGEGFEDASKISNSVDNLAILRNGKQWSIEGRKEPTIDDTVRLRIWQTTAGTNYQLAINTEHFNSNGLQAYLYDFFTATQTTLNMAGVTNYNYTVTANTASFNERFIITFRNATALPVTFIEANVIKRSQEIVLQWKVNEQNIASYTVEKGKNGLSFADLVTTVSANTSNNQLQHVYTQKDVIPFEGDNFYRIRANGKDGSKTYSKILVIKNDKIKTEWTVLQNPIKDKSLAINLNNYLSNSYSIIVSGLSGQLIYTNMIKHNGSNGTYTFRLSNSIPAGLYNLTLQSTDGVNETKQIFIE